MSDGRHDKGMTASDKGHEPKHDATHGKSGTSGQPKKGSPPGTGGSAIE